MDLEQLMGNLPDIITKLNNEATGSFKDDQIFEIEFDENKEFDNQEYIEYQTSNNFESDEIQ